MINIENIIQKCFGITHWAVERGRAKLRQDETTFDRADAILHELIKKLVKEIKDEA